MPKTPTRRRFLMETASSLAAISHASISGSPAFAATDEKLRIGVIGVGNRGVSNIAEISSEQVAALCDVDQRFLDEMSARYPDAKKFVDFRELIEHPGLDAVLISTPDHTHYHAAMLALRKGLHVYCEKPLAHSIWEVRQLAAAAATSNVVTLAGNQHHASEGYRRVVEIVRSGCLGAVSEMHAWTNRPIWPQGLNRPRNSPPTPGYLNWDLWLGPAPVCNYDPVYHPRGWRGWFDFGCGALGDMGPHLLDPVVWALDLPAPARIRAEASEVFADSFPLASTIHFEFPRGDGTPPLPLTWYDGDRQPPEAITGLRRLPDNGVLFITERAKLFARDYGQPPSVIPHERSDRIELPEPSLPRSPGHHREWLEACKGNGQASCDFAYAARLTELCLLGNLAIRRGSELHWDHDRMQVTNDENANRWLRRDYRDGWKLSVD